MSNTITISAFAENLFRAKDTVARELTGFIPSVIINSATDGVSINGTVTSLVTAQPTLNTSATPSMTIPNGDDQTITALTMTIGKVANVKIPMVGETWAKINNTAGGADTLDKLLTQALRTIVNAIETHIGSVASLGASRAVGTAGTTPFASTHGLIPDVHQILKDNGAPTDGMLSLVINTAAETALKKLSNLYKVNEAGNDSLLRQGVLLDIDGLKIRPSAGVANTTAGAMASALFNGAGAIGDTTITFDTGTVNTTGIVAGDVITVSNYKYVVATGTTSASGTFTINAPGLREVVADNTAITVNATSVRNAAFHQSAIELVVRPPIMPPGGDAARDAMTIVDTKTGLVFLVAIYGGYKMQLLDITTYYQAKVWKPDFVADLMG